MTDEEEKVICDFYAKEFPDTMPFDDISAKLDTLNNHPHIQRLRRIFCDNLVFALTEGFVKYDDASLVAYDGSLLKLVYENIEKLDKDSYFFWAFYYYLKKQYKKCKNNIHKVCSDKLKQGVLNEDGVLDFFLVPFKNAPNEIWDIHITICPCGIMLLPVLKRLSRSIISLCQIFTGCWHGQVVR